MAQSTMNDKHIHLYSDASFRKHDNIAVAGFLLFENDALHIAAEVTPPIQTQVFKERNNIRAELRGVIFALETFVQQREQTDSNPKVKDSRITLYTDCQTSLSNADLYKRFFTIYDKVTPTLFWVKGHTAKKDRGLIQKNFSRVDSVVRDVLRRQTQILGGDVKSGGESGSNGGA